MGLSYRVRDGTGRFPHAITTGNPATNPPRAGTSTMCGVVKPWGPVSIVDQALFCYHDQPTTTLTHPYTSLCGGGWGVVGGQPHGGREHHTFLNKSCVCRSFRCISTSQLHVLQRFHIWPINPVVYWAPHTPARGVRKSHLGASFPLRCFQRLSIPNVANQRCSWRNN